MNSNKENNDKLTSALHGECRQIFNEQSPNIIQRLFNSFNELEDSINSAKKTLAARAEVPTHVFERLSSYDTIISKQRRLATKLANYMAAGEWDEVARHVSLINGLSAMIRDDARSILSSLSLNSDSKSADVINFEKLPIC